MASELRVDKIHNEGGDNDSGLDMSTNDVVAVKIAGSEKMRVHSDGKVGIGVTPSRELHVQKASSGATPTSGSVAVFEDDDNTEISLLGGSSSQLAINFGDSDDPDGGMIRYTNL